MGEILWIFLIMVFVIGLPYTYSKKGIKYCIGVAYIAGIIISANLFYVYYGTDGIINSFVFSAQLFTLGVNGKELVEMLQSVKTQLSGIYVVCVWMAFLICPLLTISVLLSYVKKGLDRTTLRTRFSKEVYIFTEKNENTVVLAKDICKNDKKAIAIFSDTDETDIGARILCVAYSPVKVIKLLNKTNRINVCFNDSDAGKLLDKVKGYIKSSEKTESRIYVFTDNSIAHEVVDEIRKEEKNRHIQVVSTNAILMRDILWDYPLYINAEKREELNVTVLGTGAFGGYFAMNTLWCGIIPDCKFKLNLVDVDEPENVLSRVSDNIPAGYFDIEIFKENVNTNSFFEKIAQSRLQQSDYILVAMGNDDINIRIARKIRLYFARCGRNPFVMTVLKNQSRFSVMSENLRKDNIVVVGGTENMYSYEKMFCDRFLARSFGVFSIVEQNYGNNVVLDDFFRQKQIDILSSYANAIHCKYKVYALVGKDCDDEELIKAKLVENFEKIAECEHDRWVAFEVLKGYIGVSEEKLEEFLENNKATGKMHKNDKLKIHACITEGKNIAKIDELLYNKYGIKQNLEEIDRLIAEKTLELWLMK